MKKSIITACIAAVALFANHGSTFAADQDFALVNATGVEINALYVSPADKKARGSDILGQDTLGAGQTASIVFSPATEAEKWDLRVEDKQGNSIEWADLDLTEISKVTLHYADGKATAEVE